jgi:hypothetical protein
VGWLQRLFAAPPKQEEAFSPLHERVAVLESSLKALERDLLDLSTRYRRIRATLGGEAKAEQGDLPQNRATASHANPGGSSKDDLRRQYLKPRRPEPVVARRLNGDEE